MRDKRLILLCIAIWMAACTACTLEESKYKNYQNKDGKIIFCPPEGSASGSKLTCITYSTVGENGSPTVETCDVNSCPEDYKLAFEDGVCPANFTCQQSQSNPQSFICTNTACTEDQIECEGKCVNITNDPNNCGGCNNACNNIDFPNATSFSCVNKQCHVLACEDFYQLENGRCLFSDPSKCGNIDCTKTSGWAKGYCNKDLKCIAQKCQKDHHIYDDDSGTFCEQDTVENCGKHNHPCTNSNGIANQICYNGACRILDCDLNYHKDQNETRCIPDSGEECGAYNVNCKTKINGWSSGRCENQECIVEECADDYHIYDNHCEMDDNTHCGSHDTDCTKDDHICANGECIASCPSTTTECDDGCKDILSDVNHCGDCATRCPDYPNATPVCNVGNCSYLCNDRFGDCDQDITNGCEVDLDFYGMSACNQCASEYTACGQIDNWPLCLKTPDDSNEFWNIELVKNKLPWNSQNCARACNSPHGNTISITYIVITRKIEPNICAPKQECTSDASSAWDTLTNMTLDIICR